jgi:hypothetical protein
MTRNLTYLWILVTVLGMLVPSVHSQILPLPGTLTLTPEVDINPVGTSHTVTATARDLMGVVFQKWRWTEIAVTLGLVFVALSGRSGP